MNKCISCFHRKVCIDSANYKTAENCRQYVSEKDVQEVKHGEWSYNDLYLPSCAGGT